MRITTRFVSATALLFALAFNPHHAKAALIITATATQSTIAAGGSTDVKVYATSDSTDNIGQFNISFNIVADAGNTNSPLASLKFISPDPNNDPTLTNTSYIYNPNNTDFLGNASFKIDSSQSFGVAPEPSNSGYNTMFAGSDSYTGSDDNGYVVLSVATTVLLADLVVTFSPQYTTNSTGDLFNIILNLSGTAFGDGSGRASTVASPTNGATLAQVLVISPNLSPANAIPEPGTITLALFGGLAVGVHQLLRRRGDS